MGKTIDHNTLAYCSKEAESFVAEKCDTIYIPSFDLWSVFTIESFMEYITVAFLLRPDTQALKILMTDNTIIKKFDSI